MPSHQTDQPYLKARNEYKYGNNNNSKSNNNNVSKIKKKKIKNQTNLIVYQTNKTK